jgi:DNA (cytosine-5)-methyltransferase 3A
MKDEWLKLLDELIGVPHIKINSAKLTAQNRVRCYWTNIPNVNQPRDLEILLKDILEPNVTSEILYQEPYYKKNDKESGVLGFIGNKPAQATRVYSIDQKSKCLTALGGGQGGKTGLYEIGAVLRVPEATHKGYTDIEDGDCFDFTFPNSKTRRGRNMKDKSNCLVAGSSQFLKYDHPTVRKLTITESERLQGVEGWTKGDGSISNTQRARMLGNGFTCPIIEHILSFMDGTVAEHPEQLDIEL